MPKPSSWRVPFASAHAASFFTIALLGCVLPKGTGSDAGAAAASSSEAGSDVTATGAYCGRDPESGATLCSAISLCPSLVIDPDAWPGCGYRVNGAVIDMECACSGALCPIGVAPSCAAAAQLLGGQTQPQVCLQVGDGRCVTPAPSGAGTTSSCDRDCAAQCGGDPSCVQICGC
jgi:hypothetical protein